MVISLLLVKTKKIENKKRPKAVARFWRHERWEQIDHVTVNFGQYPGDSLIEKGTPTLLKNLSMITRVWPFLIVAGVFPFYLNCTYKRNILIYKEKTYIESCSLKEMFSKKVFLNFATPYLRKKA